MSLEKIISLTSLSATGEVIKLVATNTNRDELSDLVDVETVGDCSFEGKVRRFRKTGIRVSGNLRAEYEQSCVVTMEPVQQSLSIDIDRKFLPEGDVRRGYSFTDDGELMIDPEADEPDILDNGFINLWDVVIEELNLAIDPYPRIPDARICAESAGNLDPAQDLGETHKPFKKLNTLINEKKSKK